MNVINRELLLSAAAAALAVSGAGAAAADREWTYSHDANGQVVRVDGPRTDVDDVTRYSYDSLGNRSSVTNALGHRTQMLDHNARGQARLLVDANGVETALNYHPRGWLLSTNVRHPDDPGQDALTRYAYDNEGLLLATYLPDGTVLSNEYDAAHRLLAIANGEGERVEYMLDDAGNRIGENTLDAGGAVTRSISRAYDELNRLIRIVGAAGQNASFSYDRNGNETGFTDGNNNATSRTYDALDRLRATYAPLSHHVLQEYDERDNLSGVTDPKTLQTSYGYDGLGNLLWQSSPDTGISTFSYDEAGNRVTQTDARGVTVTRTYDALNRPTGTYYPNTGLNVSYGYDAGTYGTGRLTSIADAAGLTSLTYDHRGNVVGQVLETGSLTIQLSYRYDAAGQLLQVIYPGGRAVNYSRGANGRIVAVDTVLGGESQVLAADIEYLPFGPRTAMVYGNGLHFTAGYDLDYRVSSLAHGAVRDVGYAYDNADNITGIADRLDDASSQYFSYDALNRLASADGGYGELIYSYDSNGNRLSLTHSSGSDGYAYDQNSHRLVQSDLHDYRYDDSGNLVARISRADNSGDGTFYSYDDHNRLAQVTRRETVAGSQVDTVMASYAYNAHGQRARKTTAAATVHYLYGRSGELLAEVRDDGLVLREYIYLDGQPLAVAYTEEMVAPPTPGPEIVMDDTDTGTSFIGSWESLRKKGALDDNYHGSEQEGASYRWTPPSLNASEYEVWAWWPKSRKQNPAATYSIMHQGRTSTSVQDQSSGGKSWTMLGTYRFSGEGIEYVEVSAAGGKTVADGIRLVELTQPPPVITTRLYYIHNDHLGTAQVVTDEQQRVVWKGDYRPFGEVDIRVSDITNNLRFPGQYFDRETGLHQNHFRDYEPDLGRYIQSDPIGLSGGMNTFAYSSGNPLRYVDPNGLFSFVAIAGGQLSYAIGATAETSVYVTTGGSTGGLDAGLTTSTAELTAGFRGDLGVSIAAFKGGKENLQGLSLVSVIDFGPVAISLFNDIVTGELVGGGFGVNTPWPGGTVSISNSMEQFSLRDFLRRFVGVCAPGQGCRYVDPKMLNPCE